MTNDTDSLLQQVIYQTGDCSHVLRWESCDGPHGEVWLGTCEICGQMQALLTTDAHRVIDDPLAFFLRRGDDSPLPAPLPIWPRFYDISGAGPCPVSWRFLAETCDGCAQSTVAGQGRQGWLWQRAFSLCLTCGHVTIESGSPDAPTRLVGDDWAPPCPAVRTLRREVALASWRMDMRRGRFRGPHGEEGDG